MSAEKEIRRAICRMASDPDSRIVEGRAIVFETPSDGLPFTEIISRGALDGVIERSDVFAYLNHDGFRGVLARSKHGAGSLTLTVDGEGLLYRFEAPRTALGDELLENIRRGEIDESSFCFSVSDDTWEKDENGVWTRRVNKIDLLFDVSPVYSAAYSATSVNLRGRDRAESELRAAELAEYYANLESRINNF